MDALIPTTIQDRSTAGSDADCDPVSGHRTLGIGILCLVACVFLTLLGWKLADTADRNATQAEFGQRVHAVETALTDRMTHYEQALRSAAGLWNATPEVTREAWKAFAAAVQLNATYPGIQGLGFARLLGAEEVDSFVARNVQLDPSFHLFPAGARSEYSTIVYLEPANSVSARAIGFDMLSEPTRREAMLRARDSGGPALSGKVTLLQDVDQQPGALLYLPVYASGSSSTDIDGRRAALIGWVYSPFRVNDLVAETLDELLPQLHVQIFDGGTVAPSRRLFDSQDHPSDDVRDFSRTVTISLAGHTWTLVVTALDSFVASRNPWAPLVLVAGLAISALVFLVVITLLRSEERAREIAARIARALKESEGKHLAIVQAASEAILTVDAGGVVKTFSGGAERIFGYTPPEVIGRDIALLLADQTSSAGKDALHRFFNDQSTVVGHLETTARRKGGAEFPIAVSIGALRHADSAEAVLLIQDITDRRRAADAMAESDHFQKLLFGSVPYPVIATDNDGQITFINQAAEADLGYIADELVGKKSITKFHVSEEVFDRRFGAIQSADHKLGVFETLTADCELHGASEREWTYVRKDGSAFPAIVSISRLTDKSGLRLGFVFLVVDITERKEAEIHIRHMAHHDALTDLPNRSLLHERLALAISRAAQHDQMIGVLMLDLDHFKRINDTLGHQVGDDLLKTISKRILTTVRRSDTVARMGGDEFVIVLPDVSRVEHAEEVAAKIVESVFRPAMIGSHELQVSGSVGVALYPRDGTDEGTLLRNADSAMYAAKMRGRANYQWYSHTMTRLAEEKMALESDLRRAIDANQLRLGYQPFICVKSGKLLGFEALLRWTHPERGAISPTVFVPLAEETGLILRIGEWVIEEACRFGRELLERSATLYPISVNVSPRQLIEQDFVKNVERIALRHGFPTKALTLEITENVMVNNPDESLKVLNALRARGMRIAIDDFGTGYSSLSYITRFPVDKLKIDRSFISGLGRSAPDDAITDAIIAMARSLQLEVTAEGVERDEQMQLLARHHCHSAQGFLFGEVVSVDQIIEGTLRDHISPTAKGDLPVYASGPFLH
jgi:diguanylate cyclase (GGDEF)-like protein/PAS domain S-box-containing protein